MASEFLSADLTSAIFTTGKYLANKKNKVQHEFIHSNKFDYGYDPNGGHRAASLDKFRQFSSKKGQDAFNPRQQDEYRNREYRQNFRIQSSTQRPGMESDTKKIGDFVERFVKNEIDQDFLKRSHLPFAKVKETIESQAQASSAQFSP